MVTMATSKGLSRLFLRFKSLNETKDNWEQRIRAPEDQKDESNQDVREIFFFQDIKVELNDWFWFGVFTQVKRPRLQLPWS